jgi:hypothetical protein
MGFGGHVSEMNKRMREFREESKRRRNRRNQWRETAGIHSASSKFEMKDKKFTKEDREKFLDMLKAERKRRFVKNVLILIVTGAFGYLMWYLFFS